MKRALVVAIALALAVVGLAPGALAASQPGQGETSTGRNEAGFGGGPHCHVLVVESGQEQFEIRVFPSHTAHANTTGVFDADLARCPL